MTREELEQKIKAAQPSRMYIIMEQLGKEKWCRGVYGSIEEISIPKHSKIKSVDCEATATIIELEELT